MSFYLVNLTRTSVLHKSKGLDSFSRSRREVVLLVFSLLAALTMIGCSTQATRTFSPQTGELFAEIEGFRNSEGGAIVSLFSAEKGFPDEMERAWQNQWLKIESGRVRATFTNVPYGEYALSVLHDEDGDQQMKSSWLGKPLEGFGFSGRPAFNYGPPAFADAAFVLVSEARKVVVWMRYDTARKQTLNERRAAQDGKPRTEQVE